MTPSPVARDEDASRANRWYVMLFPSAGETSTLVTALQRLAERIGGTPNPTPHVTVGYFHGVATPAAVTACIRPLTGPTICIHASELFSWSETPHPQFGYTLSLRVRRDSPMQAWQRAVRTALAPTELIPVFTWQRQQPHMNALREMPLPPSETLLLLSNQDYPLAWTAMQLVVSQEVGDSFVTWLRQPLRTNPTVRPPDEAPSTPTRWPR